MKIVEALQQNGQGAVLADEHAGVVRLWVLVGLFRDGRVLRALKKFFPYTEMHGEKILRLGGFRSLAEAHAAIAEAKMTSSSLAVQRLFRFDVPESLATIKHYS